MPAQSATCVNAGYEPPQPKFWKAILGAGLVTFPALYVADIAIMGRHKPGWLYVGLSLAITFLLACQMYAGGPPSLWGIGSLRSRSISDAAASLLPKSDREEGANRD